MKKPGQNNGEILRVDDQAIIRQLHQQLHQERERFRGLAAATFEGLVIHDHGRIVEVNQTVADMFGYHREDLLDTNILRLFASHVRERVSVHLEAATEKPFASEGRHKDGTGFPVEIQTKPIRWQEREISVAAIRDISWRTVLEWEHRSLEVTLGDHDRFGGMIGKSPVMERVYERLMRAAASQENVILYGETGTGKELAAQTIFALSDHHTSEFVIAHCGAIQKSLFEPHFFGYRKGAFTGADRDTPGMFDKAHKGTLFLDEVGELSIPMQIKLLRVLNDKTYTPVGATTSRAADVRIIAATNRELRELLRTGKMREDFFHRIHVIAIDLPPLRWHKEDIPLLIAHFLEQYPLPGAASLVIPPEIMERFYAYDWPGNVRELYNELRRYLTTGEVELAGHFSDPAVSESFEGGITLKGRTFTEIIEEVERQVIAEALAQTQGNKSKAAKLLHLQRRSLQRKISKYHL